MNNYDWNREQAIGERHLRSMQRSQYADESEVKRLRLVERRCIAIVGWLERNKPEVFREGLWDAIREEENKEGRNNG